MDRAAVESSHIVSIGYDQVEEILEVEFTNGSVYQYLRVPAKLHSYLMSSPSKGGALKAYIEGIYEYTVAGSLVNTTEIIYSTGGKTWGHAT